MSNSAVLTAPPRRSRRLDAMSAEERAIDADIEEMLRLQDAPEPPLTVCRNVVSVMPTLADTAEVDEAAARAVWKDGKRPPAFDDYCLALDGCPLFDRQFEAFRACGLLEPEAIIAKKRLLHQIVLVYGKGSGKDYMIAKFLSWVFFVLCHLAEDPARFFGLAPYSRLSIINVASTAVQAKNVFFTQYLKRFIQHKMFADLKLVPSDERRAKADEGKMGADNIIYRRTTGDGTHYECIGIYSMHSKATSLEGHNVFASVMDEADAMLDTEDRSNAEEVYNVLQSSSQRFQNNYLMAIISYPRIKDGFMMRMRASALEEMRLLGPNASMWSDKAPTWEVNPKFDRDNADIVRQFRDNFAVANAMYGCEPMEGESAFFDVPEMIDKSVDVARAPCAIVTIEPLNLPMGGDFAYYVQGAIGNIRRTAGYSYYMAADAGAKKDAYALSVWHVDVAPEAYAWLCPNCGRDASLRMAAEYNKLPLQARRVYDPNLMCGVCLAQPHEFSGGFLGGTVNMQDWWERGGRDESTLLDGTGRAYNIGHMYEDLIVQIKPQRATNSDRNSEGGRNRMVYFPAVQDLCRKLITGLGIAASRFDPHQTMEVTQGLIASTGGDIGELPQSNPEQLRRASFTKAMLHTGLLTFLPHAERDIEWKRLQLVRGIKIDHPSGGSKDIYDAESMCIWTAAVNRCSRIDVDWA